MPPVSTNEVTATYATDETVAEEQTERVFHSCKEVTLTYAIDGRIITG